VVVQDLTGKIVAANAAAQTMLGLTLDQMLGVTSIDPAWQALHEDGTPFHGDSHPAMQVLRTGVAVSNVVMGVFNPRIGSHTWINVNAVPIRADGTDALQGVYATFQDITAQRLAERALQDRNAEFRMAVQSSSDGFWIADAQGRLLEVNQAYEQLSGYSHDELLQLSIPDLDCFDHLPEVAARMERIVRNGSERFVTVHRKKDETRWPTEVVASYSPLGGGRFYCFIKDLTEQQQSAELIWHQANFDRLTDLPNRALFFDRLSQECSAARRTGKHVALLFADLDAFKPVNDRYGHDAGDLVLRTVATRWLGCVRNTDTVARLGGDEFAVIVGNLEAPEEATLIASKLIDALQQDISLPCGNTCKVGVSIGIALFPDHAVEMDSLLSAADQAMYVCKARGNSSSVVSNVPSKAATLGTSWIPFNDAHLVGVAEIDDQHRHLVRMVNELNHTLLAESTLGHVESRFDELIRYTAFHFQTEHRLMEKHAYPQRAAHDQEHAQLVGELRLILQKKSGEGDMLVLQKIKDWLVGHMHNSDRALGQYLNQQGVF
jgi:diguanylate cyclase (GGDEF)-like protein/hemerythrin-like metal-binding protein/PAS domain S-box-containing protein